jgi:hypothetical protein
MALNITINKVSVAASFAAGATVATAVASGGTTPYVYSLATGGDKFAINSSTGVVTTIAAMDITNIASFSVKATDSTTGAAPTITPDVIYPPIQTAIRSKFDRTNVIYKITKDIDLGHGILTIPEGCTLDFQGGSFTNGTIVGTNSDIRADEHVTIFKGIVIEGTWKVKEISSGWFNFRYTAGSNNLQNLQNLFNLSSNSYKGVINISQGDYYITIANNSTDSIVIYSNTTVNLNGNIILNPNDLTNYNIVTIRQRNNIIIQGGGSIVGDVVTHTGTTGEWGMGISIYDGNNITIKDVSVKNCWGDGIYIGQVKEATTSYSSNILIDNVTIDSNRRQGISIISVENLTIRNSRIINTGAIKFTSPGAGIDIEPNIANAMVRNINIEGCYFNGNKQGISGDLLITALIFGSTVNTTFSATISNCYFATRVRLTSSMRNLTITSSYINTLDVPKTDSHYYKTLVSGCLINGSMLDMNNPGIFYSGCSFTSARGSNPRRVFAISSNAENPITKITFPKADALINIKVFSGYNAINASCISEISIRGRYINDNNNNMSKSSTVVYDDTGVGNIDLSKYRDKSVLVSKPIQAEDGSWEIYLKTYTDVYFTGIVVIEPVLYTTPTPFFTGVVVSNVPSAPAGADFKTVLSQPCHGTTEIINSIIEPKAGVVVYNDTLNKPVFGNGTTWVDATGITV